MLQGVVVPARGSLGAYAIQIAEGLPDFEAGSHLVAEAVVPEVGDLAILHVTDGTQHLVRPLTSCTPPRLSGDVQPVVLFTRADRDGCMLALSLEEIVKVDRVAYVIAPPPVQA